MSPKHCQACLKPEFYVDVIWELESQQKNGGERGEYLVGKETSCKKSQLWNHVSSFLSPVEAAWVCLMSYFD